jgi:hypothetical protein
MNLLFSKPSNIAQFKSQFGKQALRIELRTLSPLSSGLDSGEGLDANTMMGTGAPELTAVYIPETKVCLVENAFSAPKIDPTHATLQQELDRIAPHVANDPQAPASAADGSKVPKAQPIGSPDSGASGERAKRAGG